MPDRQFALSPAKMRDSKLSISIGKITMSEPKVYIHNLMKDEIENYSKYHHRSFQVEIERILTNNTRSQRPNCGFSAIVSTEFCQDIAYVSFDSTYRDK
jgi:hypothetical protein